MFIITRNGIILNLNYVSAIYPDCNEIVADFKNEQITIAEYDTEKECEQQFNSLIEMLEEEMKFIWVF